MKPTYEQSAAAKLAHDIRESAEKFDGVRRFMEVCGTHTMAIHSSGIRSLLPENIALVSGPGCPVCVTEKSFIDEAVLMARGYDAALATFGDLIRVPGAMGSLASHRAEGGDVRVIYSPADSLAIAAQIAPKPLIFLGVGFETTTPTIAATVKIAKEQSINNFFVLTAFKTIHPALKALAGKSDLHGFLLPGHVSAILGVTCYDYLVTDFHKPGVVVGFEALDILLAVKNLSDMVVSDDPRIINGYKTVVREEGNPTARALVDEVFRPTDAAWRGLGVIPKSGLGFTELYRAFDARERFPVTPPESKDDPRCRCAAIITGSKTPDTCALFGKECTPEEPVGPCMVSSEGTCAAYYKYGAL